MGGQEGLLQGEATEPSLEDKDEFFIWTKLEAFQKIPFGETGTKDRRQQGT